MKRAHDYPELAALPALVQERRRKTAGQLRITREECALRDQMRVLLDQVNVDEIECNGYLVKRCAGRDGRDTVRLSLIRNET